MEKKTYKFNSLCEAGKRTDKPHEFVLHVARCKICQEKLPAEILKSLEPRLSKLKTEIAKVAKTKEVKKVAPAVDGFDAKLRESPTIKGLSDSILKIAKAVGVMAGVGGTLAEDTRKEEADAPVQQSPQDKVAPGGEGEPVTVTEEMKQEAKEMKKDSGGDSKPVKKAPIQQPTAGAMSKAVGHELNPTEVEALEVYLSEQKQKLGRGGEAPGTEAPGGGAGGGLFDGATGLVGKIAQLLDKLPKKGGGGGDQDLTKKIVEKAVDNLLEKRDPFQYIAQGIELGKAVAGGQQQNPMQQWKDGINTGNVMFRNAISLLKGGKGNIVNPEPSTEDIDHRIDERIQKAMGEGPKTEGESV